jgi:hypothetical protein
MVAAKMFLEMNLSQEKPDHASIEDRRKDQVVASHTKTD